MYCILSTSHNQTTKLPNYIIIPSTQYICITYYYAIIYQNQEGVGFHLSASTLQPVLKADPTLFPEPMGFTPVLIGRKKSLSSYFTLLFSGLDTLYLFCKNEEITSSLNKVEWLKEKDACLGFLSACSCVACNNDGHTWQRQTNFISC